MTDVLGRDPEVEAVEVLDRPQRSRFEAVLGGDVLGFVDYQLSGQTVIFTHAQVHPELRGRGLGRKLVGEALATTAARGQKIVPRCPFVAAYVRDHPELHPALDDTVPPRRVIDLRRHRQVDQRTRRGTGAG
jgi:predicted GNAT family acetyltransferase